MEIQIVALNLHTDKFFERHSKHYVWNLHITVGLLPPFDNREFCRTPYLKSYPPLTCFIKKAMTTAQSNNMNIKLLQKPYPFLRELFPTK
jgi:hypothetical protein